jgi:ABC-type transport system involved in multi-copper enzyme maturation permease subunit
MKRSRLLLILILILIVVQIVLLTVLAVFPFGFDHPSRFGLDFEDFALTALLYCLCLAGGIALSIKLKNWRTWVTAQLAFGLLAVAVHLLPLFISPQGGRRHIGPAMESHPTREIPPAVEVEE